MTDADARKVRTIEELKAALGELTPEEQARLNDPALYAPPTEEELAHLGPGFTERVMKPAREHRSHMT